MTTKTFQEAYDELSLELYQEEQAALDELDDLNAAEGFDERICDEAWAALEAA